MLLMLYLFINQKLYISQLFANWS